MNESNMHTILNSSLDDDLDPPCPPSRTDWERLDALSDAKIDTSDIAPLTDTELDQSHWRLPSALKPHLLPVSTPTVVEVAVDEDTLAWFQAQGQDYPQRMQAALRLYAEAHQAAA